MYFRRRINAMEKFIVLLCLLHVCSGVIYRLNATEYARLPPKFAGDSFEKCHEDPDAVYCMGIFELVSDTPSPLLHMIQEYSAHNTTHFNYTLICRGICLTQSCTKFYKNTPDQDLEVVVEACLNETIYNQYQLKTKATERLSCNQPPKDMKADTADKVVGVICGLIVLANIVGSFYTGGKHNIVSRLVLCFSIPNNWKKLRAPVAEGQDPRLERLKSIHGIRTISMFFVIMAHSILGGVAFIDNPDYLEQLYFSEPLKILFSGMIIMQTFLLVSGFLLVYNSLLHAEKHKMSWALLPKYLILRWLRLTPPYALVLALTTTWFRFATGGPLWQELIGNEVNDCRKYWWKNMLYINNYDDDMQCMTHTWYLAADTQLYIVGVVVFLACTTPRSRKIVLPLMLLIGIIFPAAHTYFQNLDGSLITSPEAIQNLFMHEPTFNNTYKRGHTNIVGYTLGLAMGYILYNIQKKGVSDKYRNVFRVVTPLTVPTAISIIYAGSIFYEERPRLSIYVRMAYAGLVRPMFGSLVAFTTSVCILKLEELCRYTVEWRGWTIPSRLSYSAFLVHITFVKNYVAMQTTTTHTSTLLLTQVIIGVILISYLSALPFWLMVEAPVGNLIKEFIMKKKEDKQKTEDKVNEIKENYKNGESFKNGEGIKNGEGYKNGDETLRKRR